MIDGLKSRIRNGKKQENDAIGILITLTIKELSERAIVISFIWI